MRQLLGVKSSEFNRSQKRLNIGRELFFDDSKFDLSFCDEFQVENCALGSRKKVTSLDGNLLRTEGW